MGFSHTNFYQKTMPFSTGIHRYFAVNDKSKLEFYLPSKEYNFKEKKLLILFLEGLILTLNKLIGRLLIWQNSQL